MLILSICLSASLIVGLDMTIANVALPSIQRSLDASIPGLQWIIDAYSLVLACLLVLSGSIADRFGRRRMLKIGLTVFLVASVTSALAPSVGVLIAARALQGVGGAMVTPATMSIVRNTFEDPRERAHAFGIYTGTFGVSLAAGPVLGGLLVSAVSWRAVFFINLPLVLIVIALAARFLPESKASRARRPDPVGQVLVFAALASLTYAIIEAGEIGLAASRVQVMLVIAAITGTGFVVYELRRREPLLELRFFRSVPFAGATAIGLCLAGSLGGFLFLSTLYLQDVRGLSPLHAALFLLPTAATLTAVAPLSGRLIGRFGARPSMVGGGLSLIVANLMLTRLDADTPALYVLVAFAIFVLGFALTSPSVANTSLSSMPPEQAGVASAINSTSRQVGITLGVAVLGALVGAGTRGSLGPEFHDAARSSWLTLTGVGVVIVILGWVSTTPWARATARRTAARFAAPDEGVEPPLAVEPLPVGVNPPA